MARASLNWTVSDLAKISQVSISTIKRIETNDGFEKATKANLKLIKETFEASGIEFIGDIKDGPGVRLWENKS
jgi:transcriptional regulator with XRE-family HTH domain